MSQQRFFQTPTNYSDASTLAGQLMTQVQFSVSSPNSAIFQLAKLNKAGALYWDLNELTALPGTDGFTDCYGIRFRSADPANPTVVLLGAYFADDPIPAGFGFFPSPASFTPVGPVNPGTGSAATDVQVFGLAGPGSFTWTKPSGATSVHIEMVAAGAGGGAGVSIASGTATRGGGGGGGGAYEDMTLLASRCPATLSIVIGAGGTGGIFGGAAAGNGGLSQVLDNSGQFAGVNGFTIIGPGQGLLGAPGGTVAGGAGGVGGGGGGGAQNVIGIRRWGANGSTGGSGVQSAAGNAGADVGIFSAGAAAGGGAGGGTNANGINTNVGGRGGRFSDGQGNITNIGVGLGGTAGGGAGGIGGALGYSFGGSGGGGGGSSAGATPGGIGGAGVQGGGGGGGGSSVAAAAGGNGGKGGDAYCVITTLF